MPPHLRLRSPDAAPAPTPDPPVVTAVVRPRRHHETGHASRRVEEEEKDVVCGRREVPRLFETERLEAPPRPSFRGEYELRFRGVTTSEKTESGPGPPPNDPSSISSPRNRINRRSASKLSSLADNPQLNRLMSRVGAGDECRSDFKTADGGSDGSDCRDNADKNDDVDGYSAGATSPRTRRQWRVPWVTITFAVFLVLRYSLSFSRLSSYRHEIVSRRRAAAAAAAGSDLADNSAYEDEILDQACSSPCLNYTSVFHHGQFSRLISAQLGFYSDDADDGLPRFPGRLSRHFLYVLAAVAAKGVAAESRFGGAFFAVSLAAAVVLVAAFYGPVTAAVAGVVGSGSGGATSEAAAALFDGGCSGGLSGASLFLLVFLTARFRCSWRTTVLVWVLELVPLYLTVLRPHPATVTLQMTGVVVGLVFTLITSPHFLGIGSNGRSGDGKSGCEDWFSRCVRNASTAVTRFLERRSTACCLAASVIMAILTFRLLPPPVRALISFGQTERTRADLPVI